MMVLPPSFTSLLQCPECGGDLSVVEDALLCSRNGAHRFPYRDGVIDFLPSGPAADYDVHWRKFASSGLNPSKVAAAERFVRWFLDGVPALPSDRSPVVLDVGCGDGSHIAALPKDWIKVAIDISASVGIVARRYAGWPNLVVMRADAARLPFRPEAADMVLSYGCMNCMPDPGQGVSQAAQVLRPGGVFAVWGYGSGNAILRRAIEAARAIHSAIWPSLRPLLCLLLVPMLLLVRTTSGTRPGKSTLAQCMEIVSTNLTPRHLHLFGDDDWRRFAPAELVLIETYDEACGNKFVKYDVAP